MATSEEEIARRLEERDSARSTRRAQAATTVGELARRHTELASRVAELERELGEVLTAAGDVIDVPELAQVTDIPAADLTRWRDQAAKPTRRGKRTRPSSTKNDTNGTDTQTATEPPAARPVTPAPPVAPESVGTGGVAAVAASSG
ncbi:MULTISPECIES: hypothetical protein [Pseudonocardiaceae]|uniref:Uncharacterized protein n=1 Tax=Prauserella endophytica TaxID=1592324 RepID=A0ABY2RTS7_9PSEU|nr:MULTISPECIES: hypothetical protein [Pseudonocardiaceae]TKG60357.1 hypothetical protein FCN18_35550 [Prauserella endophytica]